MKTVGTILTAAIALLPWCLSPVWGQQNNAPEGEKKIIITKRSTDADGVETTETIVKKGKAAENFNVEQYIKEHRADNVQLDVRVIQGDDEAKTVEVRRFKNRNFDWERDLGDQLIRAFSDNDRAFLGVEEDSDEDEDAEGVAVQVTRGSAADKAGLRTNDIILKLNDQTVNEWDEITNAIGNAKPGDKMRITYARNGKSATTVATLTTRSAVSCTPEDSRHGFLGVTSGDDDGGENGIAIGVVENSAADKAGLKDGDVLLRLNDDAIEDWEDVTDVMAATKPGDKMRISYRRDGREQTAEATLGEQKSWNWDFNWEPKDLNISVREKPACLGVYSSASGSGDTEGARVSDFTKESAAADAQMNKGDVITAINGTRVKGHDDLWNEIAKFQPGDKVKVDFLRDNQPRQIEASLKACRDNSNEVILFDTDQNGDNRSREFYLWNWSDKDQDRLRERRVITIHRGAEGDAPQLTPAAPPAQDRTLKLESFRAYPNPTQGPATVEFRGEAVPTIVTLLDMSGRQLFREELNAFSGDYSQQFDLSEYAKGTIVIQVLQGDKVFTEQMVVN